MVLPCQLDQGNRSGVDWGWTPLLSHSQFGGLALEGGRFGREQLLVALVSTVDWVARGTYRTAWAVEPRCLCSYAYGRRVAVGPPNRGLLLGATPGFVEGHRTSHSTMVCRWGCADVCKPELLRWIGGRAIVGTAMTRFCLGNEGESEAHRFFEPIGSSALFPVEASVLFGEDSSCWLHHGDLLVMDGRCQYEYLHSTDPRLDGERVNITFRWLKNHLPQCPLGTGVVCCLPTCVKGLPVPECTGDWMGWYGILGGSCGSC